MEAKTLDTIKLVDTVAQSLISGVSTNDILAALAALRADLSKQASAVTPDPGPAFPVGFTSAQKISNYNSKI
jgi:hypothetical protein